MVSPREATVLGLFLLSCSVRGVVPTLPEAEVRSCGPLFAPSGPPGQRKVGVLIGVSDYLHGVGASGDPQALLDLSSPARDVERMVEALSGPGGMGYARENVCTMLDAAATGAELERFLAQLPGQLAAGDELVVYFSGHGDSVVDVDLDEPDRTDEALLPYDYDPAQGAPVLTDDRLREHLAALHAAIVPPGDLARLTLIVDACSSGTVARGGGVEALSAGVDGSLPGLVALSAARDNTVAIGYSDGGVFTTSLERAIRSRRPGQSWGQTARRAQDLLLQQEQARGEDYVQVPVFEGALSRPVTGAGGGLSADGHVQSLTPLSMSVINPTGWGEDAVVEIVPATSRADLLADPLRRRRLATIASVDGFHATAALQGGDWEPSEGDKVLLVRPSPHAAVLPVVLSDTLPPAVADEIRAIPGLGEGSGGFWVGAVGGAAEIRDAGGRLRNRVAVDEAAGWMRLHARQQALLRAAAGSTQGGLYVEALPADEGPWWPVCEADQQQLLPACRFWQPRVLNRGAPSVTITALLMTSDGCIEVVPPAGESITLDIGQRVRLQPSWAFQAEGSPAVPHTLMVVGVPSEQPHVPVWADLETTCGPLDAARGGLSPASGAVWIGMLSLQVSANPALEATACQAAQVPEALTLSPYLPPAPHPLRDLLLSIEDGTRADLDAVAGRDGLAACSGALQSGDLLQTAGGPALVVDPERGLLWAPGGYRMLHASAVSGCQRDPALSRPLPEALCQCCGAP